MYWITKTGVYQFDTDQHEADVTRYPDGVLLFEVMMFAIALLLLNLLIAIISDTFERVVRRIGANELIARSRRPSQKPAASRRCTRWTRPHVANTLNERRRERTVAPRHSLQELTQTRPLSLLPSNDLQGPGRVEPELR